MKKLLFLLLIILSFLNSEIAAQTSVAKNMPSKTTSRTPVPEGPEVWGQFHGRVSCQEMARELNVEVPANCDILKWSFTFYQDQQTRKPTHYKLNGSLYREKTQEGKWALIKGTKADSDAIVIQLDPDKPNESIFLLKGDENVLFILDHDKNLKVGGDYLCYTFNRVIN